jgi:hypothetical protein
MFLSSSALLWMKVQQPDKFSWISSSLGLRRRRDTLKAFILGNVRNAQFIVLRPEHKFSYEQDWKANL